MTEVRVAGDGKVLHTSRPLEHGGYQSLCVQPTKRGDVLVGVASGEANFQTTLTPDEARSVAEHLLRLADLLMPVVA